MTAVAQSFSGKALEFALLGPDIPGALLVSPDVSSLLGPHSSNLLLVPGALVQWGEQNSIDITVGQSATSNDNLFAALQRGDRNALIVVINAASTSSWRCKSATTTSLRPASPAIRTWWRSASSRPAVTAGMRSRLSSAWTNAAYSENWLGNLDSNQD